MKVSLCNTEVHFSAKLLAAQNKGSTRAKSLEELHDKLQALRGKLFLL
jgi:hypothetical protein